MYRKWARIKTIYFTVNSRPVTSTCPRTCVSTKKSGNSGSKSFHSSSAFFPCPRFLWNQQVFPPQVSSTVMTHMVIICNAIYASCILANRVFAANCVFVANFLLVFRNKTLALVVSRVDSAIHWITQLVLLAFIRWIVIYPVDSGIHLLNNRCLVFKRYYMLFLENWTNSHESLRIPFAR